jgi:hypothetical protein
MLGRPGEIGRWVYARGDGGAHPTRLPCPARFVQLEKSEFVHWWLDRVLPSPNIRRQQEVIARSATSPPSGISGDDSFMPRGPGLSSL